MGKKPQVSNRIPTTARSAPIAGFQLSCQQALQASRALSARGDLAGALGALGALDSIAARVPQFIEVYAERARLQLNLGDRAAAIASYRAAAAAAPATPLARLCMAHALMEEHRDAKAERWLKDTVARFPDLAEGHALLGIVQANAGGFDAAVDSFDRALRLNASRALYYDRVRARTLTAADQPLIDAMQAALQRPDLNARERIAINLALGKAADDLDDPAGAMDYWNRASAIAGEVTPFSRDRLSRAIDLMIATFVPETFNRQAAWINTDPLPLLVVGLPRSGTTLVEQILTCHPDITGAGELDHWPRAIGRLSFPLSDTNLASLAADLRKHYLPALRGNSHGATRATDKLPQNFLALGLVHLLFPNVRIIHCRRDLLDTCVSIHATLFAPSPWFPSTSDDLVFYARQYQRLMEHWRTVLPPSRLLEIDYEALTSDPEPAIRSMVEFSGLAWHPACLSPERNQRAIKTPSKWQARQPIHGGSVGRWRRYAPWLGPLGGLAPMALDAADNWGSSR
jgi:tetratricopeptide (TPR) repeat protein